MNARRHLRQYSFAFWCIATLMFWGQLSFFATKPVFSEDARPLLFYYDPVRPLVLQAPNAFSYKKTPHVEHAAFSLLQNVCRCFALRLAPSLFRRIASELPPSTPLSWRGLVPLRSPPSCPVFA